MSIFLEITQLENGDIVLREAQDEEAAPETEHSIVMDRGQREPLVRISFSAEVKNMLGGNMVGVAEAMIDAATDFLDSVELDSVELDSSAEPDTAEGDEAQGAILLNDAEAPVIH